MEYAVNYGFISVQQFVYAIPQNDGCKTYRTLNGAK